MTRNLAALLVVLACGTASSGKPPMVIELPAGKPGIGFDDLGYSPRL